MHRQPLPPRLSSVPARPALVDYVFVLGGCGLSLYLMELKPLRVGAAEGVEGAFARYFVEFLPRPLRLTEGILLLWPVFFATQLVRRRREPLTAAEWLWVVSWVGVALLTGLTAWENSGRLPESLAQYADVPFKLWYVLFVPSMAVLAVVLGVAGLLRRGPAPWTHSFAVALIVWPVAPLAGILALGRFE
jgi:hypothetical protein